jgi:hypothetical protein
VGALLADILTALQGIPRIPEEDEMTFRLILAEIDRLQHA